MADFKINLRGLHALQYMLKTAPRQVEPLAEAALSEEGQVIFARSQRLVPVRTGILRASGVVSPVRRESGDMFLDISYGGPAASYAMWVHERHVFHAPPTDRKFLQRPVEERGPNIAQNIAKRMDHMIRMALAEGTRHDNS